MNRCGRRETLGLRALAWLPLLVAPLATPVAAQISPGPLSAPHASLEGSRHCLDCHRAGQGVDPQACLSCHRALGERIAAGAGLHARTEYARCERCHAEHNGRDFELVYWPPPGRDAFDHQSVGFVLEGAHATLACRACHAAERVPPSLRQAEAGIAVERTFLGLETSCASCHRDPHGGGVGTACADCHDQRAWRPARGFDHATTRYPLTGAHREAACVGCHRQGGGAGGAASPDAGSSEVPATSGGSGGAAVPGTSGGTVTPGTSGRAVTFDQFRDRPLPDCASCHRDVHAGRLGTDCAQCHDTASFRAGARGRFDHARTAYPLRGRHQRVACEGCHPPGRGHRVAGFERCATCHRDPHAGQLRTVATAMTVGVDRTVERDCAACHDVDGFVPARFGPEEHARSSFALAGAHLAVPCGGCHREVALASLPPAGTGPGTGSTSAAAGGPASRRVRQFRFAQASCRSCHQDPHAGSLDRYAGDAGCRACHDENRWTTVRFDHDTSRFPLRGRHREVTCARCHPAAPMTDPGATAPAGALQGPIAPRPAIVLAGLATDCAGCHQDPHRGQLARDGSTACARCHDEQGFRPARFDHHDAAWSLDGAHLRLACDACHRPEPLADGGFVVRYRPLPTTCEGCHRGGRPAATPTSGERSG